ncbi:MAG TPA: hypothetical protein VHW00_04990 [Thermoanaerobaculia bacterium]|nr:hypothetical protein [Thermoanaerobaculia bacterium]
MILAILFLVSSMGATFTPPSPTVGDLVTIDFPAPVQLQPSREYEVVSNEGKRIVVRSFTPKPFVINATMNGSPIHLTIPVHSVLKTNDPMTLAPLAAPRAMPYSRRPFLAIALAALAALVVWALVAWRAKKRVDAPLLPIQNADERFRAAVLALQTTRSWGRLADATRVYLAATRPHISTDLTTTELVPRLRAQEQFVAHILRQGDVEKFSTHKPDANDFDEAARLALALVPPAAPAEVVR